MLGAADPISDIERLQKLHAAGAISDEEFAALKGKVLAVEPPFAPKQPNSGTVRSPNQIARSSWIAPTIVWLVILAFVLFPFLNEGTPNACSALERRVLRAIETRDNDPITSAYSRVFVNGVQHLSNGAVAEETMRKKTPYWPALGCFGQYYAVTFDPRIAQQGN